MISAVEQSSVIVTAVFTDEDNSSVIPNSVTWTLTDGGGTVINSREDVVVAAAASVDVLLSGDDLPWAGSSLTATYLLYITFTAEYNSASGSNIPLKEEESISVRNLRAVS